MRLLLYVAFALLFLMTCGTKQTQSEEKTEENEQFTLTKDEKYKILSVLAQYTNVDSNYYKTAEQENSKYLKNFNEDADTNSFRKNSIHIDSVIKQATDLAHEENYIELLDLLEKERFNLYAHPGNTVNNENDLHHVFMLLYGKTCDSVDEFYKKVIPLIEYSWLHSYILYEAQKDPNNYFFDVTLSLSNLYNRLGLESKQDSLEEFMAKYPDFIEYLKDLTEEENEFEDIKT